jgi:hypothetical protein
MKVTQLLSALVIAVAICPQATANVQPRHLTQSQLRQFVHCFLRNESNRKKYGSELRFRYLVRPPEFESEDGIIFAVVYRTGTLKKGLFVAFGFRGKGCLELHEGNFAPLISVHGKPDLDADSMGNGGIGTYNRFMGELRRLQPRALVEMDISRLRSTCEKCTSFMDK